VSTTESPPEQLPVTHRQWTEILGRCRFGTVKIAGKNYTAFRIKAVAERVAGYADADGSRVRPGIARIAVDLETEYRTVRDVLSLLRRVGMLKVVRAGGGTNATEYQLTLPVDLLERDDLEVWSPAKQAVEIERVRSAHRGGPRKPPRGPKGNLTQGPEDAASDADSDATQGPQDAASDVDYPQTQGPQDPTSPVDNFSTQGPQDLASATVNPGDAGSSGTCSRSDAGSSGTATQGPQDPTTTQDQDTTTTTHSGQALLATVTVSRETGSATNPDSSARPERCEHGLPAGLRANGEPLCALCRVAARRPAAPALPADAPLADVIPFPSRRAS